MTFRTAEAHTWDLLDAEDEWWQRLRLQATWVGEIESLSGALDHIQVRLVPSAGCDEVIC